ncbi:MAG TPA: ABC transporter permease, partial [Acidimicrobiia bacterium]|nr:ABC transporter permease [Acidimicrobiia bacterium]
LIDWDWIARNVGEIADRTWQHISLTAVSVGIGLIISVGLAIVALRWRWAYTPITWVTGLLYTIPSLALFALLVPVVGLNATNAVIALTSYTLLIIIRNLVAGIDGVPDAVLEAADGMGYTRRARFWKMEVPLALPVIIAGLRIATVTTVGLVTVTAVLGLGGYGYFILRGLNTFFWTQILVGVVLSVVLATVLDIAFLFVQRLLSPWARRAG